MINTKQTTLTKKSLLCVLSNLDYYLELDNSFSWEKEKRVTLKKTQPIECSRCGYMYSPFAKPLRALSGIKVSCTCTNCGFKDSTE